MRVCLDEGNGVDGRAVESMHELYNYERAGDARNNGCRSNTSTMQLPELCFELLVVAPITRKVI